MDTFARATVKAAELEIGDEFWADKPYYTSEVGSNALDPDEGDFMYFRVVNDPIISTNGQLFPSGMTCVVVGVIYADGARGSRLYGRDIELTIRRPA